jgi:hypothetical protein
MSSIHVGCDLNESKVKKPVRRIEASVVDLPTCAATPIILLNVPPGAPTVCVVSHRVMLRMTAKV